MLDGVRSSGRAHRRSREECHFQEFSWSASTDTRRRSGTTSWLPNLRRLRERSACFLLDHGKAKRTGLAWEHVSTGLSPRECRNAITGEPIVREIERCGGPDPLALGRSGSDLVIVWNSSPLGLVHPTLGRMGPEPYRRTGGHSGRFGMACIATDGVVRGDRGIASSFDVVPTLIDLVGAPRPGRRSGRSLLDACLSGPTVTLAELHA